MPPVRDDAWLFYDAMESRLTAAVSERMVELARLDEGACVLDLASGTGEPSLRAARRVGPSGRVLGLDLDERALDLARERARAERLVNLELRAANVEDFDAGSEVFDAVTARFCVMYMRDPSRALRAARRALREGGVFVGAFWLEPERIPWWELPRRVTARYASLAPRGPTEPSPFRYASLETLEHDLSRAGFAVEHVEEVEVAVVEAQTGAGIVSWVRAVFGAWISAIPEARREAWEDDLAREAELYRNGELIRLGGVTRLVVARAV